MSKIVIKLCDSILNSKSIYSTQNNTAIEYVYCNQFAVIYSKHLIQVNKIYFSHILGLYIYVGSQFLKILNIHN